MRETLSRAGAPRRKRRTVRPRATPFERDHLRARLCEQLAIVTGEQHGLRGLSDPVFEPTLARDVEVVVRLVQQQDARVTAQQCFQYQALLLATGERADGPRRDLQKRRAHRSDRAGIPQHLGVITADVSPVGPRVLARRRPASGDPDSSAACSAATRRASASRISGRLAHAEEQIPNRGPVPNRADELTHHTEATVDRDRARCVRARPRDRADEGGLADAVCAHERGMLGVTDAERHVIEELRPPGVRYASRVTSRVPTNERMTTAHPRPRGFSPRLPVPCVPRTEAACSDPIREPRGRCYDATLSGETGPHRLVA